jgi:protein ImuB
VQLARPARDRNENFPTDPVADRATLQRLARWCRRYSPVVGLEDAEIPESLLLDIAGCAHLFGGETRFAQRVLADLARLGLTAHVAIADTIGAAWAAAFCAAQSRSSSPTVIPAGRQEVALQSLPVDALRLSAKVLDVLHELDLHKIGQLLRMPRETLPSRFDSELLRRLDQALGNAPEVIAAEPPDEPIEARWGCEEPIENAIAIIAVVRRLLRRAIRSTEGRGEGILRLEVLLTGPEQDPLRIMIDCIRPTLRRKHLVELIRLQLERLPLKAGIVDFLLRVTSSAPLDESQPDLFGERDQRDVTRELDTLLNRLTSRLGRSAVLRPELHADYQPERAMSFRPVIDAARRKPREASIVAERTRPVRVRPHPLPVSVTSVVPNGPPLRLHLRHADHRIVHCDGPERIETGWWRHAPIRRDYYRIDLDSGARHWLFRSLEDGRWFLHGDY